MFDFDLPSTWNCSANLYSLPCRNSTKFWQGKRISEMCSTFWNVFASFRCWFCCCCCFYEKGPIKLLNTFSSGRSLTSVGWKRPLCQSTAQLDRIAGVWNTKEKAHNNQCKFFLPGNQQSAHLSPGAQKRVVCHVSGRQSAETACRLLSMGVIARAFCCRYLLCRLLHISDWTVSIYADRLCHWLKIESCRGGKVDLCHLCSCIGPLLD